LGEEGLAPLALWSSYSFLAVEPAVARVRVQIVRGEVGSRLVVLEVELAFGS
jgi:hypothetical protein